MSSSINPYPFPTVVHPPTPPRVIATLSGGKASAWCAAWALSEYRSSDLPVLWYFNDTKWEHPDTFRFFADLCSTFKHSVYVDADGRSVEDVCYDEGALPNNFMAFCSRILKAQRLQRFIGDGDILIFGIGPDEKHRAERIQQVYREVARKRKISVSLRFPLIENSTVSVDQWLADLHIEPPVLYKLGFKHNNCSGGCVRASKRQWIHLYHTLPEVYAERERLEREFSEYIGKRCTFLRNISLTELREQIEQSINPPPSSEDPDVTECIGICSTMV